MAHDTSRRSQEIEFSAASEIAVQLTPTFLLGETGNRASKGRRLCVISVTTASELECCPPALTHVIYNLPGCVAEIVPHYAGVRKAFRTVTHNSGYGEHEYGD